MLLRLVNNIHNIIRVKVLAIRMLPVPLAPCLFIEMNVTSYLLLFAYTNKKLVVTEKGGCHQRVKSYVITTEVPYSRVYICTSDDISTVAKGDQLFTTGTGRKRYYILDQSALVDV